MFAASNCSKPCGQCSRPICVVPCGGLGNGSTPIPPGGSDNNGGGVFNTPVGPDTPNGRVGIDVQIKDECLRGVWDMVKTSNFNNEIQNVLYDFNESQSLIATFKDESDPAHPTRLAYVSGTKEICFNSFALMNATKEGLLAVIVHELLHLYLNGCYQIDDHQFMGTHYIEPFAQLIEAWFPEIPHPHAVALAWTGIGPYADSWKDITPVWMKDTIIDRERYYYNFNNQYNPAALHGAACWE